MDRRTYGQRDRWTEGQRGRGGEGEIYLEETIFQRVGASTDKVLPGSSNIGINFREKEIRTR